jgi:hypothetical protein
VQPDGCVSANQLDQLTKSLELNHETKSSDDYVSNARVREEPQPEPSDEEMKDWYDEFYGEMKRRHVVELKDGPEDEGYLPTEEIYSDPWREYGELEDNTYDQNSYGACA